MVENPDVVSQIADFLLTYKNMQRSLCTGRYKNKLHVSLRLASANADAGVVLRDVFENHGEAGGHDNIAGGSMTIGETSPQEAWKAVEEGLAEKLMKRLRVPAKGEFHYPFR